MEFYEAYRESNEAAASRYHRSRPIFDEDFDDYPDDETPLDPSTELLGDVLREFRRTLENAVPRGGPAQLMPVSRDDAKGDAIDR